MKIIYPMWFGFYYETPPIVFVEQCNFNSMNEVIFFDSMKRPNRDLSHTVAVWTVKLKKAA